jgi:hypothetical protein
MLSCILFFSRPPRKRSGGLMFNKSVEFLEPKELRKPKMDDLLKLFHPFADYEPIKTNKNPHPEMSEPFVFLN